jgi:hypothetical protein
MKKAALLVVLIVPGGLAGVFARAVRQLTI